MKNLGIVLLTLGLTISLNCLASGKGGGAAALKTKKSLGFVSPLDIKPGFFLTPPQYSYKISEFNTVMGKASLEVKKFFEANTTIDIPTLRKLLDKVAKVRAHYAIKVAKAKDLEAQKKAEKEGKILRNPNPNEQAAQYMGLKTPETADESGLQYYDVNKNGSYQELYQFGKKLFADPGGGFDVINDKGRHKPYLEKARALYEEYGERIPWSKLLYGKSLINLSFLREHYSGGYALNHPSFRVMVYIRNFAYEKLVKAINSWKVSTEKSLDQIAESYRLLCHATPYHNGSPSIMESFLDGFFRSKGLALPAKKEEPFWQAIFWTDKQGPYQWKYFAANFDS